MHHQPHSYEFGFAWDFLLSFWVQRGRFWDLGCHYLWLWMVHPSGVVLKLLLPIWVSRIGGQAVLGLRWIGGATFENGNVVSWVLWRRLRLREQRLLLMMRSRICLWLILLALFKRRGTMSPGGFTRIWTFFPVRFYTTIPLYFFAPQILFKFNCHCEICLTLTIGVWRLNEKLSLILRWYLNGAGGISLKCRICFGPV